MSLSTSPFRVSSLRVLCENREDGEGYEGTYVSVRELG